VFYSKQPGTAENRCQSFKTMGTAEKRAVAAQVQVQVQVQVQPQAQAQAQAELNRR
jgi:hypothetical protein